MMDFSLTQQQRDVRDLAERICNTFEESYWVAKEHRAKFPEEFYREVAAAGLIRI